MGCVKAMKASRFLSMNARFSKPVIPGDSLTVSMWVDGQKPSFVPKTRITRL